MKRCPECLRNYFDDSLMYCLDDGTSLLDGPSTADEPATAILKDTSPSNEALTRELNVSGDQQSVTDGADQHYFDREKMKPGAGGSGMAAHIYEQQRKQAEAREKARINAALRPQRNRRNRLWLIASGAVILVAALGWFAYRYIGADSSRPIRSIAVLPFENRSGNADNDYLSDGLTDSLIFRFSQLPDLKVSPTSSVMHYKGAATDVAQVAKDLDVDAVLSGRLSQIGDNLNISVQLVDARTKKVIWAEQYDRKMADLLATQREIATTHHTKAAAKTFGRRKGHRQKIHQQQRGISTLSKGPILLVKARLKTISLRRSTAINRRSISILILRWHTRRWLRSITRWQRTLTSRPKTQFHLQRPPQRGRSSWIQCCPKPIRRSAIHWQYTIGIGLSQSVN